MMRRSPAVRMFSTELYGTKVEKEKRFLSPAGRWFRRIMVTGVLTDVVENGNGLKAYVYDAWGSTSSTSRSTTRSPSHDQEAVGTVLRHRSRKAEDGRGQGVPQTGVRSSGHGRGAQALVERGNLSASRALEREVEDEPTAKPTARRTGQRSRKPSRPQRRG